MPRPRKLRLIGFWPPALRFVPQGQTVPFLGVVSLTLDELEGLRLRDLVGLDQGECAREMGVSQSTVQRMLVSGRHKVADALVHGKAIHIEGGNFVYAAPLQRLHCLDCGAVWREPFLRPQGPYDCAFCGSNAVEAWAPAVGRQPAALKEGLAVLTAEIGALRQRLEQFEMRNPDE